jgi:phosphoglycerate kinase
MHDLAHVPTLDDLSDASLAESATFVRVDFNVPIRDGEVLDDHRLHQARATLDELLERGARLVLASHGGRPKGRRVPEMSLRPAAQRLAEILGRPVRFVEDCVGPAAVEAARALAPGELCVLENLRFHAGEEANDATFAGHLAELAGAYVNDAFASAHRAHASVDAVVRLFGQRAAGRLMHAEVAALAPLLASPDPPFTVVLGGAKIAGKIDTVTNLLDHCQTLLVGGGMANTFLRAQGHELGRSKLDEGSLGLAREALREAEAKGVEVILPVDLVVTDRLDEPREVETVAADGVGEDRMAVDIGPQTISRFAEIIAGSGTVFWNGPLGVFEVPPFDAGSLALAHALASSPARTVVGGGETGAVVALARVESSIDHVSTGGGASLELLEGKTLPGVAALSDR